MALLSIPWPFVDAYNNLTDATTMDWPESVRDAFGRAVEYRPLLTLAVKLAHQVLGFRLGFYHALVLIQFATVLALLVWLFRPIGLRRGLAASVALSCVAGLHTSRIVFAFVPLGAHSAALIMLLFAMALALDPRARGVDWVFLPLTLVAALLLESGLLIAPLVILLWWAKAPGVSLRGVASVAAGVALYAAIRLAFSTMSTLPAVYTGSGLGFSQMSPDDLLAVFERAPWLLWMYNVLATFLSVVASEPQAGVFRFIASLLQAETPLWNWFHVGSSLLTTLVIVTGLTIARPHSSRDRLLVVGGLVLVACGSALGFLYTRDRIGLTAGVGYGVLLYVAIAALLDRLPSLGWRRPVVVCAIGVLATAWTARGAEAYFQLRDIAWDHHLDWTDDYQGLLGDRPETELLLSLKAAALRATPADPREGPAWSYTMFERQFTPNGPARLSKPFNIRWTPDVDEARRRRVEAELGLASGWPVRRDPSGRTWTYRLRMPTPDRVRAILGHAAVEDTAGIDPRLGVVP